MYVDRLTSSISKLIDSPLGVYTVLFHAVGRELLAATDAPRAASGASGADDEDASSGGVVAAWARALSPEGQYVWRRRAEAWKFGAGLDYEL